MRDTIQLLLDTVGDDLYRFCCRLTRNRMDADDLYQDTFLKALEQQRRLDPVSDREQVEAIRRNRNFLMGIAANLWKNQWRKKKKERKNLSMESDEFLEIPLSDGEDIQMDLERKEIQARLTMHIRALPEKLKTVIYLYYAAEMQTEEIADTLHIPRGTVKSRLYLAREKLKNSLEGDGYEI
ncbi:MAG: RNA polymerase sigma factor [Lachnospiraceae bacterium]|nr:RNA polymerase sigma factor [Lachnospiraceae bacterium]